MISNYTKQNITDQIEENIVKFINVYQEPEKLAELIEPHDFEGKSCLWYIDKYQMNKILNTKIMDVYINRRWTGNVQTNASLFKFSTCHFLYFN